MRRSRCQRHARAGQQRMQLRSVASERTGVRSPISNRQLVLVGSGHALGGGITPTLLGRPEGGIVDMVEQGLRGECHGSALGKQSIASSGEW